MSIDRATFDYIWGNSHSFERVITAVGVQSVTRWEAFMPRWYADGIWKSGPKKGEVKYSCMWGHQEGGQNPPFTYDPDQTFTRDDGDATLAMDMQSKAQFIRNKILPDIWLTQLMFNALVSLVYNAGEGNVDEGRVFKLFNEGKYTAAIAAFHDHRFSWEYVKDHLGARIPDPDRPGTFLKHLVEKNGLIVRRGTEMGIAMTRIERT